MGSGPKSLNYAFESNQSMNQLENKRVAILATNGFEESELFEPKNALEEMGATVHVVSPETGEIRGWANGDWGQEITVDRNVTMASPDEYNALVIPGGVINPDKLRRNQEAIRFTQGFFKQHKPVASICHGPQMLIEADVVEGRQMTSFPSIRKDLENAGAKWTDEKVVVDEGLVTSRNPNDLPAFISKTAEEIREGKHELQTA